jgi:transposase
LPIGGDRRAQILGKVDWIAATLAQTPDLRLLDVQHALAERGIEVSYPCVQRTVKRLGLRFKKTIYATEQDRPDVVLARQLWRAAQADLDFTKLVFVDENGTTTAMTRTHG